MKKIIIAAALVLASGVTAFSLTRGENKTEQAKIKAESENFVIKDASSKPKSDIATAD
jgi:hypothetical protein